MKRHVVKPHRPLRVLLALLLVATVLGGGVWLLAEYSHWRMIRAQMEENDELKRLWQTNRELEQQNEKLRRQVAMLQTNNDIDQQATSELQNQLMELQNEVFQLTRELEFYRGIVSSTRNVDGLVVQAIMLEPTRSPNQYRFKLVLTHVSKSDKVVEGTVAVALEGADNGTARTLKLKDIVRDKNVSLDYRFKHFKRFEGIVELPSAFKPRRVRVQLLPKDSSHARIERVFEWPEVTGGETNVG